MSLALCPVTLGEAMAFVAEHHRHHDPPTGGLFAVAVASDRIVGVAIVGRPNARMSQDGYTAEVTRLCVDEAYVDARTLAWLEAQAHDVQGWGLVRTERLVRLLERCPWRCGPSKLYGAAWRACRALGYRRLITYTLPEEGGASLRGAGWRCLGKAGGGSWSRRSRPRVDTHPTQAKLAWEVGS